MNKVLISLLVVLAAAGAVIAAPPRTASADIDVRSDVASNHFPDGIQFQLFFSSDAPVTDVRLRFRILPDGVNATQRPQCTETAVMSCQAVVGNVGETYMVPGAEIVYSWEVTDEAGGRFSTDEQTVVYDDLRFEWEAITDGNVTVNYYFGDEASQRSVLNVARETIDRYTTLLQAEIDFPIKIWVYRTAQEMQPAIASRRGQGNDNSIQTLGEVGASDTALVSRDTEFLDIVRHELAHVVTGAATRGHLVEVPTWVNEGLSTYAQNELLAGEEAAMEFAVQRNQVLPITSLGASARGTGGTVSLFYAQSGSIIGFMIETYGPEKFADFIRALAQDTTDGALQAVYGFDQLGLENAWRESIGLPQFDPASLNKTPEPIPTPPPLSSGQQNQDPTPGSGGQSQDQQEPEDEDESNPQRAAGDSDDGIDPLLLVAGALGLVMVALLGAAGFVALRGRQPQA